MTPREVLTEIGKLEPGITTPGWCRFLTKEDVAYANHLRNNAPAALRELLAENERLRRSATSRIRKDAIWRYFCDVPANEWNFAKFGSLMESETPYEDVEAIKAERRKEW